MENELRVLASQVEYLRQGGEHKSAQNGSGWYFGIGVPEETRLRINKALMRIWRKKENELLLYNYGRSPLVCGVENRQVDHRVVLVLLSIAVLPILLGFCIIMCFPWVSRMIFRLISEYRNRQVLEADDVDNANRN